MCRIRKNKVLCCFLLIICFLLLTTTVYGTKVKIIENNAYEQWLKSEKKDSTIMPLPYNQVYDGRSNRIGIFSTRVLLGNSTSKFDLRDNIPIEVKTQYQNGCWVTSTSSILETHLAQKYNIKQKISMRHMEYATSQSFIGNVKNEKGFYRNVTEPANPYLGLAYYTNGSGPIKEEDMPEQSTYEKIPITDIENKEVIRKIQDYTLFTPIYKKIEDNKVIYSSEKDAKGIIYTQQQVNQMRNAIKTQIKLNGAVTGVIVSSDNKFFSKDETEYYCYDSTKEIDHQVTIIGWDDNYEIKNTPIEPTQQGAYIVLNSWGKNFGEQGFFYVSYEDANIETLMFGIENSKEKDYDNLYQHDPLGMNMAAQAPNSTYYVGNVFTRKNVTSQQEEFLTQISIATFANTNYEIYVNPDNGEFSQNKMQNPVAVSTKPMTAGYHTITLETPIKLTGEKFAIAVQYKSTKTTEPAIITIESKIDGTYWQTATNDIGESFLGKDLNNMKDFTQDESLKSSNACIKAFTAINDNTTKKQKIIIKSIAFDKEKHYNNVVGEFNVAISTENISDGAILNVKILKGNVNVTDNFYITGNNINDNTAKIVIGVFNTTDYGEYNLQINYNDITQQDRLAYEEEIKPNQSLTSTVYEILPEEGYITHIALKTTLANFKNNMEGTFEVYSRNGQILNDTNFIGTGMQLQHNTKKYTLIVTFDLNGDGKITALDGSLLKGGLVHLININQMQQRAADANHNGTLTAIDLSLLKKELVK